MSPDDLLLVLLTMGVVVVALPIVFCAIFDLLDLMQKPEDRTHALRSLWEAVHHEPR